MKNHEQKLDLLKAENPFISSSVGNPWEEKYPDIDSINMSAFQGLSQVIRQKITNPVLPCAGIVLGETGSGKTHLIGRILKYGIKNKPFSFAYIQPIEDPEQTYRYLLKEIIVNLCYPISMASQITQLDLILEKILEDAKNSPPVKISSAESVPNDILTDFKAKFRQILKEKKFTQNFFKNLNQVLKILLDIIFFSAKDLKNDISKENVQQKLHNHNEAGINFIRSKFPDIPKTFLKVLFQYKIPEKRGAVMEWLKGVAIDEADASLLGVSERFEESIPLQEHQARNILESLGILLAHYGQPLVICFDRLENYDTESKIRSLSTMIEFLVDHAKAMLPVVFVRGDQWEQNFKEKFNAQVESRLSTNEFSLKGCNHTQAIEIITSRLQSVLGENTTEPLFPFNEEKLTKIFKTSLHSPRKIIIAANQELRKILYPEETPKPVVSLDKLRKEFKKQYHDIVNDFNRYSTDRNRLRRSLELYLNHKSSDAGFNVESLYSPEDKFIDFQSKIKLAKGIVFDAVFIIDIELNNTSVRASLKRGIDFLKANPSGKAIYIRDGRCEIPAPPNWKTTNEMLDNFRHLGGCDIFLDKDQAARWYALAWLNYSIKEGDITITENQNHHRSVSFNELTEFIKQDIHTKEYSGFWRIGEILTSE